MTAAPLRVLYVTTTTYVVRYVLIHDVRGLRDRTDATIVCANGSDIPELRAEGLRLIPIPIRRKLSPVADVIAIWRVWRLLRRERFDLLHSYVPKGGVVGQMAAFLARVPHRIHSCRGLVYTPTTPRLKRWVIRLADRLTNALAHRTVFNSRADLDYSIQQGLCSRRTARYGGTGIDFEYYDPSRLPSDTRRQVREEIGVPPDAPLVLTIGRFVIEKGYRELADAAVQLRRQDSRVRFVWVAPIVAGEEDVLPDALINRPKLEGCVTLLRSHRDLRPLYAAADVLAHPSYREGVPRVLMEAAAMNLPIVASDIPGCREVVTHGVTGLLCPPRDPAGLVEGLHAVLRKPAEAQRRAKAANEDVRSRFDQDVLAERLWGIYDELCSASAR